MESSCLCHAESNVIRVYTKLISTSEVAFVTIKMKDCTTVQVLKEMVLKKLKLVKADPRLYDIVMIVESGKSDIIKSIPLWSDDKPLKRIRKYGESGHSCTNFYLTMADGMKAKIYTGDAFPGQTYKTIVITRETTCCEALQMLVKPSMRDILQNRAEDFVLTQFDNYEQIEKFLPDVGIMMEYMTPFCTIHLKSVELLNSSNESTFKRPLTSVGSSGGSSSTDFYDGIVEMF